MPERSEWQEIKTEYISNANISTRQLAAKYGVSYSALCQRCAREKWVEARKRKQSILDAKVIERAAEREAERAAATYDAADIALETVTALLQKDVDTGDTISVTDLKTITGALKDIKYVLGIRNETEKAIQEERLEALRREKKREEQQDDKTVTLIFKGMTDEEAQIAGESWSG